MRVYITDAQIPELSPFPPAVRRALRRSAFQEMFSREPRLRWLPNGLCAAGAVVGLFTFSALPHSLYTWVGDLAALFVPTGYVLLLATVGGLTGAQWLTQRSRTYLRQLISAYGHGTQATG